MSDPTTTTTTTPPATPPAAQAPADWTSGLNDELKGFVQNKGFKDPVAVLDSYRNLEKLIGVPQERVLKLPEKDEDPAWGQIFERLGKPKDAKEYDVKVPEGGDPAFADWARKTFHDLNLPKKQADALAAKWGEFATGVQSQQAEAYKTKVAGEEAELKKKWGLAYEQNIGVAKQATQAFGIDAAKVDKLEQALGFAGLMEFMHTIGSKIGEGSFVIGDGAPGFKGALAPAAALARINALRADPSFVAKYTSGDAGAREEMARLHEMAYPSQ